GPQGEFRRAAEQLIDDANSLAVEVLSCSGLDKVVADPAIQPGNESRLKRPFDVTEQNYTLLVRQVSRLDGCRFRRTQSVRLHAKCTTDRRHRYSTGLNSVSRGPNDTATSQQMDLDADRVGRARVALRTWHRGRSGSYPAAPRFSGTG